MNLTKGVSPAELFDQFFGPALFAPGAQALIAFADPLPGERVLDLACGTGTAALHAAQVVGGQGQIVGVDINPGMLAVARARSVERAAQVDWREGDAAKLDFPDNSFDVVLCQQGIQFFPERTQAAAELHRVLRPCGRLCLNLWQALEKHPLYHAMAESEARHLGVPIEQVSGPWQFPDPDALRVLLEQAGFNQIHIEPKTLEAVFPSSDKFVDLTLFAAVAFLPEFDPEDTETFQRLSREVTRDIQPLIDQHREGDQLRFPIHWNFARAVK
jgi:ubiquinone/menaquinone biosynthesis C-methylase UbiE